MNRAPLGWPTSVPPPTVDGWIERATSWLLDQLPGEYREYEVARRYPILLSRLALLQVRSEVGSVRLLIGRIRVDLKGFLTPAATNSALEMFEKRLANLAALEREVTLVGDAIERNAQGRLT